MKIVTVLCGRCQGYFRMEAFEPADLKNPVCFDCEEKLRDCIHSSVEVERFDMGTCAVTGYHDEGLRITCRDCGYQEVA